ncbi:MAG: RHS repeat protein, partial [Proteobacteria bacterium]|nr:RHS repeat protein [Pseudomonadota bacterium]MCL2307799.1 RHS repeat protein [Pseudomonadota bacterium]
GWDETKWNPSIKHDRKSKTLGYASLSQPTLRTKTTDSLGAVIDVGYDRVGNRTSERNGLGETTTYTVDPRGRRTGVSYAGGTGSASYTWDLANRIRTTTENAITTTNSYDALSVNNRAVGWDGTKWNPSF